MNNPDFQLIKVLPQKIEIAPHKIYAIPSTTLPPHKPLPIITHIGVYSGRYSHYNSSYSSDFEGCGRRSKRFYKIPKGATHFVFRECENNSGNPSGFIPGKPTFLPAAENYQFCPSPFPRHPAFAT